jgi:PKD repeat protein
MRRIFTLVILCWAAFFSNAQCPQFLHVDTSFCSGGTVNITANASVLTTQLCGDSITVLFNATGTTLAGDTNVYMHSSPELQVGEGWNGPTIGHWGLNDGLGRMTNVGTNLWAIRIQPRSYYGYSADSCLDGLWMVFRNFNGLITTNNNGANILIVDNNGTLSSAYAPVSGSTETQNTAVTYLWSDGNTSSSRVFTSPTNLTVTATGIGGCTATGSVNIKTGHAPVNIGSNVVRCIATTPVTLNAGSGFASYQWLDRPASANSTLTVIKEGSYWITTIDSANCKSYDTVTITNSSVLGLVLPDSFTVCGTDTVHVNAATSINANGDSVTIVYNAALGASSLYTATKVYFHSSVQTPASTTWGDNTVGNWGFDDGVGEMSSLGNHMWTITIDPRNYYLLSPDTTMLGIFMVFRNPTGDSTGKDDNGNNIILNLQANPPTSTFTGITGARSAAGPLTYNWSNSVTTPATYFTAAGNYTLTVSDTHSCSISQTVTVAFGQSLTVNLVHDTIICGDSILTLNVGGNFASYEWNTGASTSYLYVSDTGTYSVTVTNNAGCSGNASVYVTEGQAPVLSLGDDTTDCSPVILDAGAGFTSYTWTTGASTETITVTTPGTYTVSVTNSAGCIGTSSVIIDSCATVVVGCGSPIASFYVESIDPGNGVTFIDSSLIVKVASYSWNFGDSTTSNQVGSVVHTYATPGFYTVTLTIQDSCGGIDSVTEQIDVNNTGIIPIAGLTGLNLYPNPNTGNFSIEFSLESAQTFTISLLNQLGQTVQVKKTDMQAGDNVIMMDASNIASGIYTLQILSSNERAIKKVTITR